MLVDEPAVAAQYEGQSVSIRETFSRQSANRVDLKWKYAHDEPLERIFLVECRIDPVTDNDVVILKRLSDIADSHHRPLIQMVGTISRHYGNRDPLHVGDGGLTFTVYLNDCKVLGIGSEILNVN